MRGIGGDGERGDSRVPAGRDGDADRHFERTVSEDRHPRGDAQGSEIADAEEVESSGAGGSGSDVVGEGADGAADAFAATGGDSEGVRDDDELYGWGGESGGGD